MPAVANQVLEQSPGQLGIAVTVSGGVMGGLMLLSGICAVLCSVSPEISLRGWDLVTVLRHADTPTSAERLLRRAFVVGQVALASVLVVSMSLLGRGLLALHHVSPGFDARGG